MADSGKCQHFLCSCPVPDDGTYCSDHCRDMTEKDMTEQVCGCGHTGCG
jgi:predicted nucleic acid-binding Zn ribbon protein